MGIQKLLKAALIATILLTPLMAEETDEIINKCDIAYDKCAVKCEEFSKRHKEKCEDKCEDKYDICEDSLENSEKESD